MIKAPIDFNQTEGRLGHHSIMQYDPTVPGIFYNGSQEIVSTP